MDKIIMKGMSKALLISIIGFVAVAVIIFGLMAKGQDIEKYFILALAWIPHATGSG